MARAAVALAMVWLVIQSMVPDTGARKRAAASAGNASADQQHSSRTPRPPTHKHMVVGIALWERSGYQMWMDVESLVTALMHPPVLRATENTTWSFEVFCAQHEARESPGPSTASHSVHTKAAHCRRTMPESSHDTQPAIPAATAGTTFGTWAARLDRLIALSTPAPPRVCEELSARRIVATVDIERTGEFKVDGPVCFFLPASKQLIEAPAWQLWRSHTCYNTEVWARGPSEETLLLSARRNAASQQRPQQPAQTAGGACLHASPRVVLLPWSAGDKIVAANAQHDTATDTLHLFTVLAVDSTSSTARPPEVDMQQRGAGAGVEAEEEEEARVMDVTCQAALGVR